MAKIVQRPDVKLEVVFACTEPEARALDALVGYGDDAFVEAFYEKLGKHYMEPHEKGLRSFFQSIRDQMPAILSRTDEARKVFQK